MEWTVTMLVEREGVARHVCRASAAHDVAPDAAVVRAVASMMVERLNEDHLGDSAAIEASSKAIDRRA